MTSKKSSANPFLYTFKSSLKKCFFIPLIYSVIVSVYFSLRGFYEVYQNYINQMDPNNINASAAGAESYLKGFTYVISRGALSDGVYFAYLSLMLIAALLAVMIFKFICSKKSVNVYYSLPITRSSLFTAKYLAGAVMLIAASLIPYLVAFAGNIWLFGFTKELILAVIYCSLSSFVSAMLIFTLTAFILNFVGSVVEGMVYTVSIAAIITAFSKFVETLFNNFVYGSPYLFTYWVTGDDSGYHRASAFNSFPFGNPFTFSVNGKSYLMHLSTEEWVAPDFLPVIFWAVICAVLYAAAVVSFRRRKAEKAGFLGMCLPLTQIAVVSLSLVIYTLVFEILDYEGFTNNQKSVIAVFSVLLLAVVWIVIHACVLRSAKKILKKSWMLGIEAAVLAAVCVLFASPLSAGFTSVPDADDIESVAVTTGVGDVYAAPFTNSVRDSFYYEGSEMTEEAYFTDLMFFGSSDSLIAGFDSKEDIELVRQVNEEINETGGYKEPYGVTDINEKCYDSNIVIEYTLKNKSRVVRCYNAVKYSTASKLVKLTQSENYKDAVIEKLDPANNGEIYTSGYAVALVSPKLDRMSVLNKIDLYEMMNEVVTDIKADRMPICRNTTETPVGFIMFAVTDREYAYSEVTEDFGLEGATISVEAVSSKVFEDRGSALWLHDFWVMSIPVYPSMSNTVAYLENEGLSEYFKSEKQIVKAELFSDKVEDALFYGMKSSLEFSGCHFGVNVERDVPELTADKVVTDPETVEMISDKTLLTGVRTENGYFVRLTFDDGSCTMGYIPESLFSDVNIK